MCRSSFAWIVALPVQCLNMLLEEAAMERGGRESWAAGRRLCAERGPCLNLGQTLGRQSGWRPESHAFQDASISHR